MQCFEGHHPKFFARLDVVGEGRDVVPVWPVRVKRAAGMTVTGVWDS